MSAITLTPRLTVRFQGAPPSAAVPSTPPTLFVLLQPPRRVDFALLKRECEAHNRRQTARLEQRYPGVHLTSDTLMLVTMRVHLNQAPPKRQRAIPYWKQRLEEKIQKPDATAWQPLLTRLETAKTMDELLA